MGKKNSRIEIDVNNVSVPENVEKEATSLFNQAFDFVKNRFSKLNKELEDFDKRHEEIKEKVRAGARRTSGRVI